MKLYLLAIRQTQTVALDKIRNMKNTKIPYEKRALKGSKVDIISDFSVSTFKLGDFMPSLFYFKRVKKCKRLGIRL